MFPLMFPPTYNFWAPFDCGDRHSISSEIQEVNKQALEDIEKISCLSQYEMSNAPAPTKEEKETK